MKPLSSLTLPLLTACTLVCATTTSCRQESSLPPVATSEGVDSSNIAALNNIETQSISSYKGWDFGKEAYLHTQNILDFGVRPIESEGHKKTQDYITKKLEKCGWSVMRQSFTTSTPYGERTFTNLIARHKDATTTPNVVLSAHYDAKQLDNFLAADDAASCVAAILEIGENLPKHDQELAKQMELVFFDGEEALKPNIVYLKDGLYGSIYYSQYLRNDVNGPKKLYANKPAFGILLDMIGHNNLSVKIPIDTPYSLLKTYLDVVAKHDLQDRFGIAKGSILDDHYPMNEIAGLPTIDIIGDFSSKDWWHTTDDNLSNISQNSLNVSIQVALEIMNAQLLKK